MSARHRNGTRGGTRGGTRDDSPPPAPPPLAVPVWDSHAHLDIMDLPVGETLAAARAVGVDTVVQVGVDVASSRWGADLAMSYDEVWAAVAVHPNEAGRGAATDEALRQIEALAGLPQVRAVGETGLDHFRTGPEGTAAQEDSFRAHIAIAKQTGTALMIHDRDAHDDVLRVLTEEGAPERVVFHCFSGDAAMAKVCADRGYALSFSGTLTFRNAPQLRQAAALLPAELLLVETDAPFLTPTPHRGRPNAPYLVPLTVRALAETRDEDVDALCHQLAANSRRLFGL